MPPSKAVSSNRSQRHVIPLINLFTGHYDTTERTTPPYTSDDYDGYYKRT